MSTYFKGGASSKKMQFRNLPCDKSHNRCPRVASVAWIYASLLSSSSTCRPRCENWSGSHTFFKTKIYFPFSEIPRQYLQWWNRCWVIRMTLIFLWLLPYINRSHLSFEYASFNKSSRIMRHGFSPAFLKSAGTHSWKRTCYFPDNCR